MKINKQLKGFTMVETLIVLAVMSILFVTLIGSLTATDKQSTFTTAVYDLQQEIDNVITNAENGQYNGSHVTCNLSGAGVPIIQYTATANTQGTNTSCEFIGVAMYFRRTVSYGPILSFTPLAIYASQADSPNGYQVAPLQGTTSSSSHPNYQAFENTPNVVLNNDSSQLADGFTYNTEGDITLDTAHGAQTSPSASSYPFTWPYVIAVAFNSIGSSNVTMQPYLISSTTTTQCTATTFQRLPQTNYTSGPLPTTCTPGAASEVLIGDKDYLADYTYGATLIPAQDAVYCYDSQDKTQSAQITIGPTGTSNSLGVSTKIFAGTGCL